MDIRDAVEADAEALAAIADSPVDVMRNLVHDRTVRVAADDDTRASDPNTDAGDTGASLLGFVSFDARDQTVHVTQFGGQRSACVQLLREPIRFAEREGMSVELLVETERDTLQGAAEQAGFKNAGPGPMFETTQTIRYRLDP